MKFKTEALYTTVKKAAWEKKKDAKTFKKGGNLMSCREGEKTTPPERKRRRR